MKKSELKALVREIVMEAKKLGASTMTKSSEKKTNTKMKKGDKVVTDTKQPKDKKMGTKLPIVQRKSNTDKKHVEKGKSTPKLPTSTKKNPALPVGAGKAKKALKEEIVQMIRESINEMAKIAVSYDGKKLSGSISNDLRKQDSKSPTGYSLVSSYRLKDGTVVPAGTPVDAPKNTGANYKKVGLNPNMGRPKAVAPTPAAKASSGSNVTKLNVSYLDANGKPVPVNFDFLNSTWPQAKSFLEREVMTALGVLEPGSRIGMSVYQKVEDAKEAADEGVLLASDANIVLYYDAPSKELKVK